MTSPTKSIVRGALAGLPLLLAAGAAEAHSGAGHAVGFMAGIGHPLGGADHVLAMVAVGILAAQQGGRAIWALPAVFVAMLAVGGLFGAGGAGLPLVELGIVGSVIVLGAVIATGRRLPVGLAVAMVGAFAVFHGHAHGTEMPAGADGLAYGAGFLAATALLHAAGLGLAVCTAKIARPLAVRLGGGAIALVGLALAAS